MEMPSSTARPRRAPLQGRARPRESVHRQQDGQPRRRRLQGRRLRLRVRPRRRHGPLRALGPGESTPSACRSIVPPRKRASSSRSRRCTTTQRRHLPTATATTSFGTTFTTPGKSAIKVQPCTHDGSKLSAFNLRVEAGEGRRRRRHLHRGRQQREPQGGLWHGHSPRPDRLSESGQRHPAHPVAGDRCRCKVEAALAFAYEDDEVRTNAWEMCRTSTQATDWCTAA